MKKYTIIDNDKYKLMVSPDMNYVFDKTDGFSAVWGNNREDDPNWSPYGPLIADIEITTSCKGPGGKLCSFCYKSNNPDGEYMSLSTFIKVFNKLPDTLQQIAFGVDAQCESNPDVIDIMAYCRDNGVIPNVTVADITNETAICLSELCGAVAVSRYQDKKLCYDSVKLLTDRGMKQTNIHMMISDETYLQALETITDIAAGEPRLKKLNAIVFLSLKKKGRGDGFTPLSQDKFDILVDFCLRHNIRFGFDSCSAHKFLESIKYHDNFKNIAMMVEPCESTLFSMYLDVKGDLYPCSFCENINDWKTGVNILDCDDFINDIWCNTRVVDFRKTLLDKNRNCPVYDI